MSLVQTDDLVLQIAGTVPDAMERHTLAGTLITDALLLASSYNAVL